MPVMMSSFQHVRAVGHAAKVRGRKRTVMIKREPNGRAQRSHEPDRGTEELQKRRAKAAGNPKTPIDITDPIDVLHRGVIKHLDDRQAKAAAEWRRAGAIIGRGGPQLAMMREPTGPGRELDPSEFHKSAEVLSKIDSALAKKGPAVQIETRRVVRDREEVQRMDDLKAGLTAIADALGIW